MTLLHGSREAVRTMRKLTMIGLSVASTALTIALLGSTPANASPTPAAQPAAINSCTGGGLYEGSGQNQLSNGLLTFGTCTYKNALDVGALSTVNISYHKTSGGSVTLRFGWEYANPSGTAAGARKLDQGAFTETSGQTKTFQWTYGSPGYDQGSGSQYCWRGVLIDQTHSDTFTTTTVCPSAH